jgi:hypothetical protein
MDIQTRIRDILCENVRGDDVLHPDNLSEEELLLALRQKGVVDEVMQQLQFEQAEKPYDELGQSHRRATHFIDKDDYVTSAVPLTKGRWNQFSPSSFSLVSFKFLWKSW